ncbi:MAG: CDP-diacylglycerol--glycerol-3-phosphate 3-phosphatidyltransferase [Lachnospiraceae bacterium]|nr:CDP-diacylglycerol--glycerol-3-phosphate 3-phosphatidyltransferase [Lachnospiraceae bacterium]
MNLPNKLTILRILLIPVMVLFLLVPVTGEADRWIAVAVFIIASLTDFADGRIARGRNLVTNFGKLMDPMADKLLVCSALVCLVALARIPAWIVILIIAREFAISGVRQLGAEQGRVIAASYWGKFKTFSQMLMIICMIVDLKTLVPQLAIVTDILMWTALALTLISMMDYLIKNRDIITAGGL